MRRRAAMCALGLLLCAAVAACGDDAEPAPAKAGYQREANALCRQLGRDTKALADRTFAEPDPRPSLQKRRDYERANVALQRAALARLRALRAPPADEQEVVAIWAAMEDAIAGVAALEQGAAGETGPEPPEIGVFDRRASAYGLTQCAAGG